MTNKDKKGFAKWLETLQQESWQLELIISGFSIFLLLGAHESLINLDHQIKLIQLGDDFYHALDLPYRLLLGAWYILVINLIVHVLLRGLWISTIGLRYVSGEIDFELLDFSNKFDQFLKKRIVSFDAYIERLEKLCSIVFAFTFLIVSILISIGLSFGFLIIIGLIVDKANELYDERLAIFLMGIMAIFMVGFGLYAFDFITLGWLKRKKRFAKFYYPIYRFYSFITLASVYRPLYYNLIDNNFGRWVGFLIIPYLVSFSLLSSLTIRTHAFLPYYRTHQSINYTSYEDSFKNKNQISFQASIPSRFVKNGFLQLFLPYNPRLDDKVIQMRCPDLKPAKTGTGFQGFIFNTGDPERYRMNADSALNCNAQRHKIYINDSLFNEVKFKFHHHPTREVEGLMTILDIAYLPRGEHAIKLQTQFHRTRNRKDTLIFEQSALIPFWKE